MRGFDGDEDFQEGGGGYDVYQTETEENRCMGCIIQQNY